MSPQNTLVWEVLPTLLAGGCVLAIYSFLWRENRVYRVFEHAFIGVSVGVWVVFTLQDFLVPQFFSPLWRRVFVAAAFRSAAAALPDAVAGEALLPVAEAAVRYRELFWLLPAAFGSLYYAIYSRRYNWLARLVIGYGLGVAGGQAFEGFFSEYLPQIFAAFRPLMVFRAGGGVHWGLSLLYLIITLSTFTTMSYFIFTVDQKRPVLRQSALSGRLMMMVSFGAIFGSTVTARLALLIERLQFMYTAWLAAWREFWDCWWQGVKGIFL